MNKIKKNTFLYDLTKAQEIAYIQYKYCFHKESMNVVLCLFIKQQLDYELFLKAFNVEIQRNDCLRLFYVKKDRKLKQYFSEPYEIGEIERVDFIGKTKADQDEFFKKDASKPVRFFKGELFRIKLIKTYDGRTGIYFAVPHMNMDAVSVFMFYKDLLNVYTALRDNTEMPKPFSPFAEYIEKEKQRLNNKEKTDKDEQFFRELFLDGGEPLYVAVNGPEPLEKLRKKRRNPELRSFPINNPFMDKSENIKFSLNPGLSEKMDRYCSDHNTTPVFVLQNAVRAYAQKRNNGTEDFIFCSICNMRATLADKNTSGTMANGLMVRTMIKAETKYSDSVVLTGEAISRSFRHADYDSVRSMALLSGIYKTRLFDFYTSFLFSYIPVIPLDSWDIDAQWISNGRFAMHLYLVAIKNPYNRCYDIYYEYRTKFLNEEEIKALHNGICKIIEHGSDNPEMTLNDLYKKIND